MEKANILEVIQKCLTGVLTGGELVTMDKLPGPLEERIETSRKILPKMLRNIATGLNKPLIETLAKRRTPTVVVIMEGGLIHEITSDIPVNLIVKESDTELDKDDPERCFMEGDLLVKYVVDKRTAKQDAAHVLKIDNFFEKWFKEYKKREKDTKSLT